jgi:hypothetical protein
MVNEGTGSKERERPSAAHRALPAEQGSGGAIRFPETTVPQRQWRRGRGEQGIFDHFLSVQVSFLPLTCRGESLSPAVATDHQSAQRGEKAVTQHPTEHPVEHTGVWTGTRIHGCIVVTLHTPTRMMGLDHKGRRRAGRLSPCPRDTPKQPGAAWSPSHRVTRSAGTEEPCAVLIGVPCLPVSRCQPETAAWQECARSQRLWESQRRR